METSIEIDDQKARVRFGEMPARVHAALVRKTTELRLKLEALVKRKLSGEVLNVVSGRLRRSIFSDQKDGPQYVQGRVAQSADVPYGRIHEFGGQTRPHIIEPVKARMLAFAAGGKTVFAARVNHPGSKMPMRSFTRSSLKDMAPEIVAGYKQAALEASQ